MGGVPACGSSRGAHRHSGHEGVSDGQEGAAGEVDG